MDLIKERLTFPEARLCRLVTEDRIWSEAVVLGVLTDGGSSAPQTQPFSKLARDPESSRSIGRFGGCELGANQANLTSEQTHSQGRAEWLAERREWATAMQQSKLGRPS